MASLPEQLFHKAAHGDDLSWDEVHRLVAAQMKEGLFHDYKSSKLFRKGETDGRDRLRRTVASFANSEGGLVLIGINGHDPGTGETPWTYTDPWAHVARDRWESTLRDLLAPLAPQLQPPPRWFVAPSDNGKRDVIVVVVHRSETAVVLDGELHLRFGDGSHTAPPHLMSDLVAGRKRRPLLLLEATEDRPRINTGDREYGGVQHWEVDLGLRLRNAGLSSAPVERVVVVTPFAKATSVYRDIAVGVQPYIDVLEPVGSAHARQHTIDLRATIPPLDHWEALGVKAHLPRMALWDDQYAGWAQQHRGASAMNTPALRVCAGAAVAVLAADRVPEWHELTLRVGARNDPSQHSFELHRTLDRPRVGIWVEAWHPGDEAWIPWDVGLGAPVQPEPGRDGGDQGNDS